MISEWTQKADTVEPGQLLTRWNGRGVNWTEEVFEAFQIDQNRVCIITDEKRYVVKPTDNIHISPRVVVYQSRRGYVL